MALGPIPTLRTYMRGRCDRGFAGGWHVPPGMDGDAGWVHPWDQEGHQGRGNKR